MKKMNQITTASLKISMLALLFFVTAAPSIIENGRSISVHQENLKGENSVASGNLDHFAVPNTNELGQANQNSSDVVTPPIESLRQARGIQDESDSESFAPNINKIGKDGTASGDSIYVDGDPAGLKTHSTTESLSNGSYYYWINSGKTNQVTDAPDIAVTSPMTGQSIRTDNHRLEVPMDQPGRP